jgi:hypothetical protein
MENRRCSKFSIPVARIAVPSISIGEMYRRWTSELIGFIKGVTTSSEARRSLMSPVHDILISDDSNPWKGVFS